MSNKHLKTKSHKIKRLSSVWWYEEPSGIYVVMEPSTSARTVHIPWRAIRNALARKDKS